MLPMRDNRKLRFLFSNLPISTSSFGHDLPNRTSLDVPLSPLAFFPS
jgi:hypothetical protein